MREVLCALWAIFCLGLVQSAPNNLVISTSTIPPSPTPSILLPDAVSGVADKETSEQHETQPIIHQFDINSNISNRYAKTLVTSKVKNPEQKAKEATFTVILPEKAFISEFVMVIDGKSYKAYVKEKEEAKQIYDKAVSSGLSAGHVAVSARDSNRFTVSVNVEPEKKATFLLTYEELLERRNNQYELVLNIHPGQVVKDMNIEVFVNESRPLKFVRTPSLRSGNEISKNEDKLDPNTEIKIFNSTSAIAKFKPDAEQQQKFGKELGLKENEGISGQFVLQYDVERNRRGGEVLLQDGYFVHFFAPDDLEPLSKHVVFVLDTSGSMYGNKIRQLREAMVSILNELRETDIFHIVEFNTNVFVWNVLTQNRVQAVISNPEAPFEDLIKTEYPAAVVATKENIEKGKEVIQKLQDDSLTNILDSLETALHLVNVNAKNSTENRNYHQPLIVFLTDGEPTIGESDTEKITKITSKINAENNNVPIFSLSFGDGADKNFLRKLSLRNHGFSRHIYEASDAALQLQEFYKQVSSPLLAKLKFEYTTNAIDVTRKEFPIYFRGSELVTAGRINQEFNDTFMVKCFDNGGITTIPSVVETPVEPLERLWAYLTIKKKLEERELADHKTLLTKEALDLALKYSFVTDVSSLVVVKPNDTGAVNTEDASKPKFNDFRYPLGLPGMAGPPGMPVPNSVGFQSPPIHPPYRPSAFSCTGPGCYSSGYPQLSVYTDSDTEAFVGATYIVPPRTSTKPTPFLTTQFPWLKSALNGNGKLSILGVELDLGEFSDVSANGDCYGTPLNSTETGICSLIKDCPIAFPHLIDFTTYSKYACNLDNRYAGICCPKLTPVLFSNSIP